MLLKKSIPEIAKKKFQPKFYFFLRDIKNKSKSLSHTKVIE